MGYVMQPARIPAGGVFSTRYYPYTTGQAFIRGAVLIEDTAGNQGNVKEGATGLATGVVGIALQSVATAPGFAMANSPTVVTNQRQNVSVAIADNVTIFQATLVNNSAVRIPALQTYVGVTYGVSKFTDWSVDINLANSVKVVDVDFFRNIAFFKFLASVILGM